MEVIGWIIGFLIGVPIGYLAVTLWMKRKSESSEEEDEEPWEYAWNRELPRRDNDTAMETRILTMLEEKGDMPFTSMVWEGKLGDNNFNDEEFLKTLHRLEDEGKVVRIAEPTARDASVWALAKEK